MTRKQWAKRPKRESARKRLGSLALRVMLRDGCECVYCGARPGARKLTIDHLVPRAKGGTDQPTNLVTACKSCNSARGRRGLRAWISYAVVLGSGGDVGYHYARIRAQARRVLP